MREIKFRAWNHLDKEFCDLSKKTWMHNWSTQETSLLFGERPDALEPFNAGDFIIEQFVGVTDSKGVEIFEGDIIEFTLDDWEYSDLGREQVSEVEYIDDEFTFDGAYFDPENKVDWSKVTVIGNVHQHPELLTPSEGEKV